MEIKKYLQKFHRRLVWEAFIKACICGAIIGFGTGTLVMGLSWLTAVCPTAVLRLPAFNGTWLALAVGVGVTAVSALLFYWLRFRPTVRDAARRVDALGLEERTVTMLEAEGDSGLIPTLQRADATAHLSAVPHTRLKLAIFKIPAVIACVCILCMAATVIIPNARGVYTPPTEEEIIDRLIEELREEIDAAENVRETVKDALRDTVDKLEESLEHMESTQEKVDAIEKTADEIHEILEKASDEATSAEEGEEFEEKDEASGEPGEEEANEALDKELQDTIRDALEQMGSPSEGEPSEGEPSEGKDGENGEGENGNNGNQGSEDAPPQTGNNGQGGNNGSVGNGQYDPQEDLYSKSFKDGKTPYTDEYDAYFKQEMARLENQDLSDAEREMIARYFAAMMVGVDKAPA